MPRAVPLESLKLISTPDRIGKLRPTVQLNAPAGKPRGLWYSCGTEWMDWCVAKSVRDCAAEHLYSVDVDTNTMLVIRSMSELTAFSAEYGVTDRIYPNPARAGNIDWAAIAAQGFAGVEICPYQQDGRFTLPWYHTWDVASGCIWDPRAVLHLEHIRSPV